MKAKISTNMGLIQVLLDVEKAPKSVENFKSYVESGHYINTLFHRVIDGFMIQGGGFEPGMKQKLAPQTVENESKNGLKNEPYTIAMARTSAPHSATSQFFINVKNNAFLDYPSQDGWGYAVFGTIPDQESRDVVDLIRVVNTTRNGMFADVPVNDVVIESIEIEAQ